MVIGVTGGVGAGKSQVLALLEQEFHAVLLVADAIGHQVMEPGQHCYERIIQEFGTGILTKEKTIDRSVLGRMVFSDAFCLKKLNGIVHPAVKAYICEEISRIQKEEPSRLIVIEAALLIEDHYDVICDELWYVDTEETIRRKRLKESRGYSDEKIDSIMKNQLSEEEFRLNCHKIIHNSGTLAETLQELKKALEF